MIIRIFILIALLISNLLTVYAIPNLDSLEKSLSKADDEAKLFALAELAWYYHNIKPSKGIEFAKKGLILAEKMNKLPFLAEFNSSMAANYFILTDYNLALKYYRKAIKYADSLNNPLAKASYISNVGKIYKNKGDLDSALLCYQKATEIYRKHKIHSKVSSIYSNMASIYETLNKLKEAEEYYNKALKISITGQDSSSMSMIYNNLALLYQNHKNYNKAENYLNKALLLSRAIGDSNGVVTAYVNIGLNYELKNNYRKALETYKSIMPLIKETEDLEVLTNVYNYTGAAYYYLKNYSEAIKWINKSLEISKKQNLLPATAESYAFLQKIFEATGDYKSAYNYSKKLLAVNDSLANARFNDKLASETARITSQLRVELELEKKNYDILRLSQEREKEKLVADYLKIIVAVIFVFLIITFILYKTIARKNKILNKTNEELKRKEDELRQAIAVKDKFFRIIAHDLKTPLGIFHSYLNYLTANYDKINDDEKKEFIEDLQKTSQDFDQLLDDLLLWAKVQTGTFTLRNEYVDLSQLTMRIVNDLEHMAKAKSQKLISEFNSGLWLNTDIKSVFIVIRNLLTNAIKFTPHNGVINIRTYKKDEFAVLEIQDNGIGISDEQKKKLFSYEKTNTNGTDNERGTGLGLLLTKQLIELNNGRIEFESKEGEGSTFRILIPLTELNNGNDKQRKE